MQVGTHGFMDMEKKRQQEHQGPIHKDDVEIYVGVIWELCLDMI